MDVWMNRCRRDGWMDGWMHAWMDAGMDACMDGCMDGLQGFLIIIFSLENPPQNEQMDA